MGVDAPALELCSARESARVARPIASKCNLHHDTAMGQLLCALGLVHRPNPEDEVCAPRRDQHVVSGEGGAAHHPRVLPSVQQRTCGSEGGKWPSGAPAKRWAVRRPTGMAVLNAKSERAWQLNGKPPTSNCCRYQQARDFGRSSGQSI